MKNTITASAIATMILLTTMPTKAATKVFLLAGQSNMAGEGMVADLVAPYNAPLPEVKFWNNNAWTALQGGFGDGSPGVRFGPELSFGHALHNLFPADDIYLVKYGLTSTSLAVNWNPNGTGECYNTFKAKAKAAIQNLTDAGESPVITGMLWMQGENDALNSAQAAVYSRNLTELITTARQDFSAPKMDFVVGRILPCYGTPTDSNLVRNAQMIVPSQVGHASWIDTDDLQLAFTGHYGTQGQLDLGIRFANEFVQTPEPSTTILGGVGLLSLAGYWWWKQNPAHAW